jgi:alpha-amylase/alpha-mannosidase (GH57 family)
MTDRCICIHGHFYQPPRENPWLEAIEVQDSAAPYHDWNARITAECYAPNATARILDEAGKIVRITNNYTSISFNFGAVLLAWLQAQAPEVYRAVVQADEVSRTRYGGHGSALAMPYNHMIMPLANRRDKYTQIAWAMVDFRYRFGRPPEGMWLPETAVDLETLDIMAELGIQFTILSPLQAAKVRPLNGKQWIDVVHGNLDPTRAYRLNLPSGRNLALFFYDGPISHAVAFENLLHNGEVFARRLTDGFRTDRRSPQLVHIATDGETYGHHQRYGDMALAYALNTIETNGWARLTNYGQFLESHPPSWEAVIHPNSSWSCPHGVERWRANCGCRSGRFPHWHQQWRKPLRTALDWLRDFLAPAYEAELGPYLQDPWQARTDYIRIILDRSDQSLDDFFHRHAKAPLQESDRIRILKLLEMQRHTMMMYTSCGWFFDDISGIETVQILQYAGRAMQIAGDIFGKALELRFMEQLAQARSNIPVFSDGRRIFERFVRPAMVDLGKVAAHYAISSLYEDYPQQASIFCFSARRHDYQCSEAGKAKLAVGRVEITSRISRESSQFYFGLVHLGDHNIICGTSTGYEADQYQRLWSDLLALFKAADLPNILKLLDSHFQGTPYSIKSLFRDKQRRILNLIMDATVGDLISIYRHMYAPNVPLMRFLKDSGSHPPKALYGAAELVLNHDLMQEFGRDPLDFETIQYLLEEADLIDIALDTDTLEFTLRRNLEQLAEMFGGHPEIYELLDSLTARVELVGALPFDVNLRRIQDICFNLIEKVFRPYCRKAEKDNTQAERWVRRFRQLGERLRIRLE